MKLSYRNGPRHAVRILAAAVLAAVVVGSTGAPLAAQAEPVFTAGTELVSWQSSDTPSVEPTLTAVLDWTIGSSVASATAFAAPAAAPVKKKKRSVRRIIIDTGREAGLNKAEIQALLWMAWRESRFHPTSHSRSNCHGLFQLSKGMAHGKPWKDPEWNTKRAIKYMRGRYGGVLQAKRFWQAHHWY